MIFCHHLYKLSVFPPASSNEMFPLCGIVKKIRKIRVCHHTSRNLFGRFFVSHVKSTHDTSIAKYRKSSSVVAWPPVIEISQMKGQGFDPWAIWCRTVRACARCLKSIFKIELLVVLT
jgi:hypothetical protein